MALPIRTTFGQSVSLGDEMEVLLFINGSLNYDYTMIQYQIIYQFVTKLVLSGQEI